MSLGVYKNPPGILLTCSCPPRVRPAGGPALLTCSWVMPMPSVHGLILDSKERVRKTWPHLLAFPPESDPAHCPPLPQINHTCRLPSDPHYSHCSHLPSKLSSTVPFILESTWSLPPSSFCLACALSPLGTLMSPSSCSSSSFPGL